VRTHEEITGPERRGHAGERRLYRASLDEDLHPGVWEIQAGQHANQGGAGVPSHVGQDLAWALRDGVVRLVSAWVIHHVNHHEAAPAQGGKPGGVNNDAGRA
jgi:hypothetical protein